MTEGGELRTVAALYVDPRGPYPTLPGVECWDEQRDATTYPGPHPVVAHPPCGPWGDLAHLCKYQDASLALVAVEQVRRWGGVLEHPARSRVFRRAGMPHPGELPDSSGGVTLDVEQVDWGHQCRKPTWLYLVGVRPERYPRLPKREPTHGICGGWGRPEASKAARRITPVAFAEFLVALARGVDR